MKNLRYPITFIAILLLIAAGVWAYRSLQAPAPTGDTGADSETSGTNFFKTIFPFLTGGGSSNLPGDEPPGDEAPDGVVPKLRQVTAERVSGARFVNSGSTTPLIRYMERETGHMFDVPADSYTATRITNTTVPGIERMVWITPTTFILQSLGENDLIENFLGRISTTTSTLSGTPLSGFKHAATFANGTLLLATERDSGVLVETARSDGSQRQTVFTSPLQSWIPRAGGAKIFLQTAPTSNAAGFVYELKNGVLTKVAGGIPGLIASVSPSGRYVAVSSGISSFTVIDTEKKNSYAVVVRTLADKCGWVPKKEPLLLCGVPESASGTYPDDWLLGRAHTDDALWLIEPIQNTAQLIANPVTEAGASVDSANIVVDDTATYALFTNRNDLSLWALRLDY